MSPRRDSWFSVVPDPSYPCFRDRAWYCLVLPALYDAAVHRGSDHVGGHERTHAHCFRHGKLDFPLERFWVFHFPADTGAVSVIQ